MTNASTTATPRLTVWLGWLLVTAVLVTIAYFWLDRPIAFYSHNELHRARVFIWMQRIPEWFRVAAPICLMGVGIYALTGRVLARPIAVLFLASLSLVASGSVKDQLKVVFGRYWPDTWTHNNPSLIGNGSYGFHPFSTGSWYESFPSGHTTSTCAVIAVLWFCWPKFRWLYVLIVLTVAVGLLGANYHFLGDIIAGAFVGSSVGWIAVLLWEARGATSVLPSVAMSKPMSMPPPVPGTTIAAGARETPTVSAFSGESLPRT